MCVHVRPTNNSGIDSLMYHVTSITSLNILFLARPYLSVPLHHVSLLYACTLYALKTCVCRSSGRGGLRGQDSGNVKLPASFWISFLSLRISPPSLCISLNLVFSQKASSTDLYLCILKLTIYYIVQSAGTKADVFIRPISKNE